MSSCFGLSPPYRNISKYLYFLHHFKLREASSKSPLDRHRFIDLHQWQTDSSMLLLRRSHFYFSIRSSSSIRALHYWSAARQSRILRFHSQMSTIMTEGIPRTSLFKFSFKFSELLKSFAGILITQINLFVLFCFLHQNVCHPQIFINKQILGPSQKRMSLHHNLQLSVTMLLQG